MSELEIYKGMVKKMKDEEIKEILDYFKDDIEFLEKELINTNFQGRYITIRDKECDYLKKLLDYITNLQHENERLKETNVYCNRTDCIGRIKDSKKYDSVYQEKEDYKSRIEKAIEYIKEHEYDIRNNFDCYVKGNELLNILNDKE